MTQKLRLVAASLILGIGLSGTAQADFVDFGDYLQDNATGLQWLDVTSSTNRSWNEVNSQFGLGGDFEGWRYATQSEFNNLIENWTGFLPVIDSEVNLASPGLNILQDNSSIDGLVQALGPTIQTEESYYISGFLFEAPVNFPDFRHTAFIADEGPTTLDFPIDYVWIGDFMPADYKQYDMGSYLVRSVSPVPAPAALPLALLGLGLVGVAYRKRKMAAKATV